MLSSPSPADTVAGNTDTLTEILRRLPPKSLLRFKSISKEWQSLISSTFFASLHHHSHSAPPISGVFLHRPSKSTLEFALLHCGPHHRPNPTPLPFPNSSILQSSNGLLLLSSRRGPHTRTLHVYNPTTGASSVVEPPSTTSWMNLVFDPSESPHYQLISIDANSRILHRFSSATEKWSPCSSNFNPSFSSVVLTDGVYWRGSLHWLGPTLSDTSLSSSLLFNIREERFIPMPPVLRPNDRRKRRQSMLESSGGKLLLIDVYEEGEIRVMEMKDDYSSWEVISVISAIGSILEAYPMVIGRVVVEGASSKEYYKFQVCGVVDGEVVIVRVPGKVLGFGIKSNKVWEMREVLPTSASSSDFEWIDVFPYVETLACV